MTSRSIVNDRVDYPDGTLREMVIWELDSPVPGSSHPYKYRLFFGVPGTRLIGYDNERGKGDHRMSEDSKSFIGSLESSGSSSTSGMKSTDGDRQIRTLTIAVEWDPEKLEQDSRKRVLDAVRNGYNGEYMTFSTADQLFASLPPKRWTLIDSLMKSGPTSLRGLARAVGRDVKRVHEDVASLLEDGIVERDDGKKLFVPFARIKIAFDLFPPKAA